MKEYKSFYKEVQGNEGGKCNYSTRLDTYGCGCEHDCNYCYAKSLLSFRGLWDADNPSVADIEKVKRKIKKLPRGSFIRLGGMTDCFAPIELKNRVTLETIKELNKNYINYLIVTKSDVIARDEYIEVMDKDRAHIQVTVTCTDDDLYKALYFEKAALPSKRIKAIEKLYDEGFDVQIRLSPFIPQYVDLNVINNIRCEKMVVEFLRVNTWIEKWFNVDFSDYTVKQSGYRHLPLDKKLELIKGIKNKRVTVCEDEDEAYEYWKHNFNPNPDDCCDLR